MVQRLKARAPPSQLYCKSKATYVSRRSSPLIDPAEVTPTPVKSKTPHQSGIGWGCEKFSVRMGQAQIKFGAKVAPINFAPKAKDESNKLRRKNSLFEEIVDYLNHFDEDGSVQELVDDALLKSLSQADKKEVFDDPRVAGLNKIADEVRAGNNRTLRNQVMARKCILLDGGRVTLLLPPPSPSQFPRSRTTSRRSIAGQHIHQKNPVSPIVRLPNEIQDSPCSSFSHCRRLVLF